VIQVGLVGCGHIGTAHAIALQQLIDAGLVNARLTAAYDEDPQRSAKVAHYQGAAAEPTLDALLHAVDAVWICSWTAGHLEAVEAAADRGVAIFCEKPLAPDLETAERVTAALQRVPHQVGLLMRSAPVFRNLAERVASGTYGRVLAAVMRDDQYFPIQGFYGSTWRKDVARAGGGTLIEHSIHDVDLLRWLLGDPVSVTARTASRFGHPGIEDTAAVTFSYGDESIAQLTSVWHQVLSRESGRRLEVFCELATMWTDDDYLGPLFVQTADGIVTVEGVRPEWANRLTVPEPFLDALAQYAAPTKAFLDVLTAAGPAAVGYPSAHEALAAHRLVDAAYRSANSGGVPIEVAGSA
jgi:predicted dehydrogenase